MISWRHLADHVMHDVTMMAVIVLGVILNTGAALATGLFTTSVQYMFAL